MLKKCPLLNEVSALFRLSINIHSRLLTSSIPSFFSHSQFSPEVDRLKARQSRQAQGKSSGPLGLRPIRPIRVEVTSARVDSCRYYLFLHPHYPFIILSLPNIDLHHLSMYTKRSVCTRSLRLFLLYPHYFVSPQARTNLSQHIPIS